jgi:tetratricopeptide (TPR) repeat protein
MLLSTLIVLLALQGGQNAQQASAATPAMKAFAEGTEYLKNNDNEKALAAFERAISLDAKNAEFHLYKCRTLAALRRHSEAIPACTESLRLNPNNSEALRDRGHYYLNLGQINLGMADLKKAESLVKTDRGIYYHLGLAYYLKGDFASAAKAYEGCLANSNDDATRVECSAWLYPSLRRAGREADAKKLLDSIQVTSLPGHPGNYLDRILLFKGLKTEDEVAKTMPVEGGLSESTVGYGIGLWHLLNGRRDRAKAYFEKAVATNYTISWGYRASEAELKRMR